VMAHELSHVALRHGTNQATKAMLAETGLGIFGAVFGGQHWGRASDHAGQFHGGRRVAALFENGGIASRRHGNQVLYDTGYDPRAMAAVLRKTRGGDQGKKSSGVFFSDHPNPEHRVERVDEEVERLGGAPANAKRDSAEFEAIKREVLAACRWFEKTNARSGWRCCCPSAAIPQVCRVSGEFVHAQVSG